MDDLSNIFDECERYLRIALNRWKKQLPDLYEDAFQEGMIQCWRDVEAGEEIKLKILRHASMSANKFMYRNGEYFFGKPRKSRDGLRTNAKTVEKVQVYLEETKGIREGVWPAAKEVSDALGISHSSAQKILKDIKEGRIDHMVYREDGRMDWSFYKTMSVELMNTTSNADTQVRHWTEDPRIPNVSWEDNAVSEMDMELLMSKLNERHRKVLHMYLYEGHGAVSIGEYFGHTTNVSTKGHRHITNAVNQARLILAPHEGQCSAGHARTEANTYVKQRADGVWYRICTECKRGAAEKTNTKVKREGIKTGRKEKKLCPRNHIKDRRDSRGSLRCLECRKEAQKKYYDLHKEYYLEYQKDYYENHRKNS